MWDVIPNSYVGVTLDGGWLTFLAGEDKRRLAPVPLYWVSASDVELSALLESAKPVGVRSAAQAEPNGDTPPAEERA